jgi:hypothetical protein
MNIFEPSEEETKRQQVSALFPLWLLFSGTSSRSGSKEDPSWIHGSSLYPLVFPLSKELSEIICGG